MAVAGKVAITLSTENGGAWSADVTYDRLVAVKHNNNLYISRKTVANVEPPNNEFWFLALEGFSGDDIEDIIDGSTQVGNAKTLDGLATNTNGKKGVATILADYGIMEIGRMIDFHTADGQDFKVRLAVEDTTGKLLLYNGDGAIGYVTNSQDLLNYLKSDGSNGVINSVLDLNDFHTGITLTNSSKNTPNGEWWLIIAGGVYGTCVQVAYSLFGGFTPKFRYCAAEVWSEWYDLNKEYFPLDGSKAIIGNNLKHANGYARWYADDKATQIYSRNEATSDNNARYLEIANSKAVSDGTNAFRFADKVNGVIKQYTALHTGNKPTGTYTGNGSAATRTINIGGIGKLLHVFSPQAGCHVILGAYGGTYWRYNGTVGTLKEEEASYNHSTGVFSISTDSFPVNNSGYSYEWNLL